MEQIKELLNILKETPEMALWGIGMYFTFILLKMASWVTALTMVVKMGIKRYFDFQEKKQDTERERELYKEKVIDNLNKEQSEIKKEELRQSFANEVIDYFDKRCISNIHKRELLRLLDSIRSGSGDNLSYIHESNIRDAIKAIKENKQKKQN